MEKRIYQSLRELPLMLSMMDVASVLGISKAGAKFFLPSGLDAGLSFHRKNFWSGWKSRLQKVLSLRTSYFAVFVIFV